MPNTFTQIHIQIVFTVKGRESLIAENHREELQMFISGIINNRGQKVLAIYAMPDHVHILVGMKPNIALSDLVRDIKSASSKHINDSRWVRGKFQWQEGFGGFSYSKSHVEAVIQYILNQREHHHKKTFREEYLNLLTKFEVDFDEKYLFEWYD